MPLSPWHRVAPRRSSNRSLTPCAAGGKQKVCVHPIPQPSTCQSPSIANRPGVACPEAMLCSAAADGSQPLADLRRGSVSAGARLGAPNTGDPVLRHPWEMEEWLPHVHSDFTLQVPAATPWIPTPVTARHPRAHGLNGSSATSYGGCSSHDPEEARHGKSSSLKYAWMVCMIADPDNAKMHRPPGGIRMARHRHCHLNHGPNGRSTTALTF